MTEPQPKNLVVILLDSLNRHMLGAYGGTEFDTPNLDRFAGDVPALHRPPRRIPALHARPPRHPGRRPGLPVAALGLDGGLGGRPHPGPAPRGVTTMLVSDHPHLFEAGGENYHTDFTGWDYVRGTRTTLGGPRPTPAGSAPRRCPSTGRPPATATTTRAPTSAPRTTSPGPRTMSTAGRWIRTTAPPTTVSSCSSTSSTRTSPSTPHCLRARCTTTTGTAPWPSGRPTSSAPWPAALDPGAGPPAPGQLRRQADHDRPLVRPDARRPRPGRPGRHRRGRVHRPRPLPRRTRPVRQARRPRSTRSWAASR